MKPGGIMTALERRGKRILLFITVPLVFMHLASIGYSFSEGLANVRWFKSVVTPLGMICAVIGLWQGDEWLRRLLGAGLLLMGGSQIYLALRHVLAVRQKMESGDEILKIVETAFWGIAIFGALYACMGLVLLWSPNLRAFLRYQREGRLRENGTD
jgi:hypothetical protein